MSHDSAVSNPPPMAKPLTAATMGFSRSKREDRPAKPLAGIVAFDPPAAVAFKSFPAENALSPAPVRTATQRS